MKKTHDYIHHYRGYWSDGGRCRIRIYQEGRALVVICTQLPDNDNTSVTNMAEYLAAEVIDRGTLPDHTPDLDRALPGAHGGDRGVLTGDVLRLGTRGGVSGRYLASSDRRP